jgi:hypothetical protein
VGLRVPIRFGDDFLKHFVSVTLYEKPSGFAMLGKVASNPSEADTVLFQN